MTLVGRSAVSISMRAGSRCPSTPSLEIVLAALLVGSTACGQVIPQATYTAHPTLTPIRRQAPHSQLSGQLDGQRHDSRLRERHRASRLTMAQWLIEGEARRDLSEHIVDEGEVSVRRMRIWRP